MGWRAPVEPVELYSTYRLQDEAVHSLLSDLTPALLQSVRKGIVTMDEDSITGRDDVVLQVRGTYLSADWGLSIEILTSVRFFSPQCLLKILMSWVFLCLRPNLD